MAFPGIITVKAQSGKVMIFIFNRYMQYEIRVNAKLAKNSRIESEPLGTLTSLALLDGENLLSELITFFLFTETL